MFLLETIVNMLCLFNIYDFYYRWADLQLAEGRNGEVGHFVHPFLQVRTTLDITSGLHYCFTYILGWDISKTLTTHTNKCRFAYIYYFSY